MIHSLIENSQPEPKLNSEQTADDKQVSPSIANVVLGAFKEVFRDVPGYEENYSVSNLGRIFGKVNRTYLTPHQNRKNLIWSVKLCKDGVPKHFSCAKVVALTWIENPNPKLYNYAIHKDGNTNDYTLENIMWGTASQAVLRKWERHPELKNNLSGFKVSPTKKMSDSLISDLLRMRQLGYSCRQLADIFPIKKSQIANILKRHNCA